MEEQQTVDKFQEGLVCFKRDVSLTKVQRDLAIGFEGVINIGKSRLTQIGVIL